MIYMYPYILQIGAVTIHTFGVLVAAGFLVALMLLKRTATKTGLRIAFVIDYIFSILIATMVAGRLMHVLLKWELFQHQWTEALYIWDGGLSIMGMLMGSTAFFYYLCFRHQQRFLLWMDNMIPSALVFIGFCYVGLFFSEDGLSGVALGTPTTLPWGISADFLNSPYAGTPVHPLALYMAAVSLVTVAVLEIIKSKKPHLPVGTVFYGATAAFMAVLAITESLRWEVAYAIRGINITLVAALIFAAATSYGLIHVLRGRKRRGER